MSDFSEGLAAVAFCKFQDEQTKCVWGYIDKTGKLVIPAKYEEAGAFVKGVATVSSNGKMTKIDRKGKPVDQP